MAAPWVNRFTCFLACGYLAACNTILGNEPIGPYKDAGLSRGRADAAQPPRELDGSPLDAPPPTAPGPGSDPGPDAGKPPISGDAGMSASDASEPSAGQSCSADRDCTTVSARGRCAAGSCVFDGCQEGFAECGGRSEDCESLLGTNRICSACSDHCQHPTAACDNEGDAGFCFDPSELLSGARIDLPCGATEGTELCWQADVVAPCAGHTSTSFIAFGGQPDESYDVTIRIRGVVEPRTYVDGMLLGEHWMVGGTPTMPSGYNVYSLTVSDPEQTYYLNHGTPETHHVFAIEYDQSIRIHGGAAVILESEDSDCKMVRNCASFSESCVPVPAPGGAPTVAPLDGQYVQIDVLDVVALE